MEAFAIENLSFTYPDRIRPALYQISASVETGSFVVVIGGSGSGKTTLLRNLKGPLTPSGIKEGEVVFFGKKLGELTDTEQAKRIGYVFQNPDHQIVTDKVWHELAFGLESLGMDQETIRLRVTEMASFFGIQDWFYKKVSELSGGQKQILNLASVGASAGCSFVG
ncbi:MAG: ABC transporter ATP-binding protein [Anaerovoracaceae bacterium]